MTSSPRDFDVSGDWSLWQFAERLESLLESRDDMTSQLRQLCAARYVFAILQTKNSSSAHLTRDSIDATTWEISIERAVKS